MKKNSWNNILETQPYGRNNFINIYYEYIEIENILKHRGT